MRQRILTLAVPCLILASCSSVGRLETSDSPTGQYPETNPADIVVYATQPDTKYTVIGQVVASADAGSDAKVPVALLKKQAAKLGADAIVDLTLEIGMGYWTNAIKATGTAVKTNK
ncbi:hypothetical protein FFWV33_06460 [Flavobacterium faecale]|uniref:Uncharacterized protein n=1 Tax=Flavobacterium faecale TaxID=1355330 RepID=A0A2S1LBT5_9FLAO|nr:hypothetical protein [Flavobacterium faecale]AWG21201.1 hypothetical protein FFWV33_06460 [Flavobacterium faecale]